MSKSYDTFLQPTDQTGHELLRTSAYKGMPELNWETVSQQAQSGSKEYHDSDLKTTTSYEYDDGVEGDVVKTQGDSENPDSEKRQGDSTSPDTHKMEYNGTLSDGSTGERDTIEYDGRKTETTFSGRQTSVINDGADTTTYGDIADTGKSSSTDREQMTGRNEDAATLLAKATAFIERSSAFMWLKEQLDSCFYPGFYTEDEEGSANI